MKKIILYILLSICFFSNSLLQGNESDLFRDLMIVDYWNRKINDRMPVTYDNFLQGGYFNMPSARMGAEGEFGAGYSSVHPYRNYNLRLQLIDRLEVSGNYRIFKGVDDPILSPLGFGDMSDKGANVKLALFHPEDSQYRLPGLAIGLQDFIGTQNFRAEYIVLTQVFINQNLEMSLGYGAKRIRRWFGGVLWMPFRQTCYSYLQGLSLAVEYDATPYKDPCIEKHPRGRIKNTPFNVGFKYRLWNLFDFSLSYVRGHTIALSGSTSYNFGNTRGFVPKIDDPLPYQAPINTEPLGLLRPEETLTQDLYYAFKDQGFALLKIWLSYDECLNKTLRIDIVNTKYRLAYDIRNRLNQLLACLIPADIDRVIVVLESEGFPVQEYHYTMEYVRQFANKEMGPYELDIVSPITEVTSPDCDASLIFKRNRDYLNFELLPKTHTFFGSARGKFKYSIGLNASINGFLPYNVFYNVLIGYAPISDLYQLGAVDRLNPSQLINVRTDITRYYKYKGVTIDEAYLQKVWNMGRGCYSRLATGYFEIEYAGVAGEFLYYPVDNLCAIGFEGAILKKRTITGLGFTNKIRRYKGIYLTHENFPFGSQYFVDLYYDWRKAKIDLKLKLGKFLANDWGARYEFSRKFDSGLRITLWCTVTNGHDKINGKTYYDKGIAFTMPLDIFYTCTARTKWNYELAAWLRDVGVTSYTGKQLYWLIQDERE